MSRKRSICRWHAQVIRSMPTPCQGAKSKRRPFRGLRAILTKQSKYAADAARARLHYTDVDDPGRAADTLIEQLRMQAHIEVAG